MTYMTAQAERYFNESALREDAVNAIDATENVSVDEAQAVAEEITSVENQTLIAFFVAQKVDCPELKNLQRKAESIIEAMRIEELTAQKVREMSMKLVKTGRFWSVLSMNNNCFYMSLDMKEALEKLAELRGRSK